MLYIYRNEQQYGPYTDQQLLDFLASGNVSREDFARREDWTEWKTVNDILPAQTSSLRDAISYTPLLPTISPINPPTSKRSSAQIAFILSLLSATICLWFLSIPAIIIGHGALSQSQDAKDRSRAIRSLAIGYPVLIIGLIAIAISSLSPKAPADNTPNASDNTGKASAESNTPAVPERSVSGPKIGDTAEVGNVSIQITKIETKNSIGPDEVAAHANPGATYLVVYYNITNRGKETEVDWSDNNFRLEDAQDRSYAPSSDATTALMYVDSRKDFMLSDLQPDVTKSTCTAFEIPDDAAHSSLTFVVSEDGFLGSHSKRINLQ